MKVSLNYSLDLPHSVCLLIFLIIFAEALPAAAQTARLSGQITDAQSAAIAGATVEAVNQETLVRRLATADGSGAYTIPYLPGGRYRVLVQAAGFGTSESGEINLGIGQSFVYNVQLAVAAARTTVNVEGGAEAVAQVNVQNSEIAGTITAKEVTEIELNGRNFTQLIALVPGVSNQTQQDEAKVGVLGSVAYSVNGGRTEYNSFNIDGSEVLNTGFNKDHSTLVVYPSVDAIQEIKVLTSNYGAQYPSTGNGTTLVTTKSGTDLLHGNLYEFLRNEDFNAKGYFDVTHGPPLYRRNDFGGTLGGPIVIPRVYDGRGRTHFFFSEEFRIETSPTPFRQALPSLAERSGDFSDVCPPASTTLMTFDRTVYPDCPSYTPGNPIIPEPPVAYPNNQLSQIQPLSRATLALLNTGVIPTPNAPASECNTSVPASNDPASWPCYAVDISLPTYYREELFRIDHAVGRSTNLSFRYIHDDWDTTTAIPQYAYITNNVPSINNRFYGPGQSMVARVSNVLSPTLLNEFIFSYTNSRITLSDVPAAGVYLERPSAVDYNGCVINDCGYGSIFNNGFGGKLPGINISGSNHAYGGTGFAVDPGYLPWEHSNPVYTAIDNVDKTLREHNIQFGGEWLIFQRNQVNGPIGAATGDVQGLLTYSNQGSSISSGNAFADFLLQTPLASFQQDSGQARYRQRFTIVEPYLQDDWKVTPHLTVNAGLRLSLFGTYRTKQPLYNWVPSAYSRAVEETIALDPNNGSQYDIPTGRPIPTYLPDGSVNPRVANGLVRCGKNGVPESCMSGHLFNPAPRVGFAWDPFGDGKTSVRAGYGLFFEHGTADEANTGSLEGGGPSVLSMTQINFAYGGINCAIAAVPCGAFPLDVTSIPTHAHWSYIQQWSGSLERELPGGYLTTLAYVGSKGTHLTAEREINQLRPVPASLNPFGPHEALRTRICQLTISTLNVSYNDGTGLDGFGSGDSNYHLPSGTVVPPSNPAYQNLTAACHGVGSSLDPNALRQFAPGLGQIYSLENVANSSYSALQMSLRKVGRSLTLGAAYTYSHSLDDASDRSDSTFTNSFDLKSTRASSNFDQRQLLHLSYIYQLPLHQLLHDVSDRSGPGDPSSTHGSERGAELARNLLDSWQLSGLALFETGIPFTVVNGGSPNLISVLDNAGVYNGVGAGSYPDLVGNVHGRHPSGKLGTFGPLLLNPGAFAAPRALTFGSAGRNALNNPQRWNFDSAVQKDFILPREMHLQFRAEAFNVFNHTQFRIYNPTLGNQANNTISCYGAEGSADAYSGGAASCLNGSSFLHPIDAHRPRTVQFGLKLAF